MKKSEPLLNQAGYDLLVNHILKPANPSITKSHEQLIADEVKRVIRACIGSNFKVMP